ncbi:hypothetical protein MBRA_01369 [Methylobacterium brachiatum]|nr:hypothetical protein MBRA_01369 [Methylobacterium brachiatum]
MSERTPATDKGTADRIEADDGGYWVRLVTKQALKREGVCMGNCLDSMGYGSRTAGDEDMVSDGLWSLRQANGVSYLLVEVDVSYDRDSASVTEAKGPMNSDPSAWACRQFRHLVAAFLSAGCVLAVRDQFALTGADGMTWRPDKAPEPLRLAHEERLRRVREERERVRAEIHARYERRAEERRNRQAGGWEPPFGIFTMQSMADAIIGTGSPVISYERADAWFEWGSHEVTSDRIIVDPARGYYAPLDQPGSSGGAPLSPWAVRELERVRRDHPLPEPTVQQRLMTGFAQASLTPDTSPRPREPPSVPRSPSGHPGGGGGQVVTPADVRRLRRYQSVVGAMAAPVRWLTRRPRVSVESEMEAMRTALRHGLVSREAVLAEQAPRPACRIAVDWSGSIQMEPIGFEALRTGLEMMAGPRSSRDGGAEPTAA